MMRIVRATVLAATLAALAWHPMGAWACSCAVPRSGPTASFYLSQATVVFEGTAVTERNLSTPYPPGVMGSERHRWTFHVDRTMKGSASGSVDVLADTEGASCGYVFTAGKKYRVYADQSHREGENGALETGSCSGNRVIPVAARTELPAGDPWKVPLFLAGPLIVFGAGFVTALRKKRAAR
jgi:hypothetical protein